MASRKQQKLDAAKAAVETIEVYVVWVGQYEPVLEDAYLDRGDADRHASDLRRVYGYGPDVFVDALEVKAKYVPRSDDE